MRLVFVTLRRYRRRDIHTLSKGIIQTSAPIQREGGKEFQALGPDAQKVRPPTVFNVKVGTYNLRKSDDLKARTGADVCCLLVIVRQLTLLERGKFLAQLV